MNSTEPNSKDLIVFATILSVILMVALRQFHATWTTAISISAIILLTLVISPSLNKFLFKHWIIFGLLLQKISLPLIFAATYYLVITPIALWFKIIKRDALKRTMVNTQNSYWEDYDSQENSLTRYRKMY